MGVKGVSSAPGDFIYFKSQVPLHRIPIGTKQWKYYDFGPKVVPPLICLPGIAGTADVYYKQIMFLSMKGYRVISVDIPRVWNYLEWIQAFEKFLDAIDVHHIHLYGTSLGGFLAQLFTQYRPRRVKSLILSNTYLETKSFSAAMPWVPIVSWAPSFLLKRYVLTGIRDGPHEPFIADSVDFVVYQVEMLSREDLASRLTLTVDDASIGSLLLSDSSITIMDVLQVSTFLKINPNENSVHISHFCPRANGSIGCWTICFPFFHLPSSLKTNDYCAVPLQLKDQLGERYPGARRAHLKTGGDFPFLSRPDEVNLHLQLHLRRVGVDARPDLVQSIPKGGTGSGPSEKKDESEDRNDPHKNDDKSNENSTTESQISPAPESSESHSLEDQSLDNAEDCYLGDKMLLPAHGEHGYMVVDEILRRHFQMAFLTCLISGVKGAADSYHLQPLMSIR